MKNCHNSFTLLVDELLIFANDKVDIDKFKKIEL